MAWQSHIVCVDCWRRLKSESSNPDRDLSGRTIHTKIVGVTADDHQDNIELLDEGEALKLVREPSNPHDRNAIAVEISDGDALGYISRDLAAELAPAMDAGQYFKCTVTALTGGTDEQPAKGVNILIEQTDRPPDAPPKPGCCGCMGCLAIIIFLFAIGLIISELKYF